MSTSLSTLGSNLLNMGEKTGDIKKTFKNLHRYFVKNWKDKIGMKPFNLLLQKGIYPYEESIQ